MAASLQHLLAQERFNHKEYLITKTATYHKQLNNKLGEDDFVPLPRYICHDQKSSHSSRRTRNDKSSLRKGSSRRLSSDTERSKSLLANEDESVIDDAAIKAVISILSGYVGRYVKDVSFREIIREKCSLCLIRRRIDSDNKLFANLELGIASVEKLSCNEGTEKELRMKALQNSIQLLSIVASVNSRNGSTCGVPNSHLSACAQLYISIAYKFDKNERKSATHLLQVFCDSPSLARTHLLPDIWEHLFLPHLLHLKIWYHKELEFLSNTPFAEKEKISKALSKVYNDQMDMGTSQFALYYKEWLKVGAKAPPLPVVPLPSRPSYAPSRRKSSDSYSSYSSGNRNLFQAVFGGATDTKHQLMELNCRFRNSSMDSQSLEDERVHVRKDFIEDYASSMTRSHRRSSSQSYRSAQNELWPETQKSHHFRFFSCHSVALECIVNTKPVVRSELAEFEESAELPSNDVAVAINTICSSDVLSECENAVHVITRAWLDSHGDPSLTCALTKGRVIEGILEVLFASNDDEVLELAISVLAEFVSRNEGNCLILLNSDPQLEIFINLLKSSSLFLKAAVLLYLLKPKAKQMISTEWVMLSLRVLEFGDQVQTLFTVRCLPRKAAMYFLDQLLTGFTEHQNLENASLVVSLGGLSLLVKTFKVGDLNERINAAALMSCCIQADCTSGNYLAENLDKTSLLELIVHGMQNKSNRSAFDLLIELLCLCRRKQIIKFLMELNHGWNEIETMHIFLVYLRKASVEERPLVAAILLQLDLLGDPFKYSIYREEAVDAIIEGLDCEKCDSSIQEQSARALSILGGAEATTEDWLLRERSLSSIYRIATIDGSLEEEENVLEDWQRRVGIVLLISGGKRFLAALSNSIANGLQKLAQSSLFTVGWMSRFFVSLGEASLQSITPSKMPRSSFDKGAITESVLSSCSESLAMLVMLDRELIDPLRKTRTDESSMVKFDRYEGDY